jgi:hypothetical protein
MARCLNKHIGFYLHTKNFPGNVYITGNCELQKYCSAHSYDLVTMKEQNLYSLTHPTGEVIHRM